MEFLANTNSECCTPTGRYELCGCSNGVAYVQLTIVGGGTVQTAWLNTETGDTYTTKPAGFVTGTCSEAAVNDVLKFNATAPTATIPFATPKDGDTTVQTSDGTSTGTVTAVWLYEADSATWVKIPSTPSGGLEGQVLTSHADGTRTWEDPATQAIFDNQVLTGDNSTNTTITLTPTTVEDESGGDQVNYTIKAEVKIDGTTIIEDPVTKELSVVFPDAFKEQNRFYADANGSDTAGTGANENPFLTAQKTVDALTANDTAVLNEGTYTAVTMSVQNTALTGASGAYGSLTQIASITVSTASGTSNKISDLTVLGNLERTGNAPLYLNNSTVSGNVTLAGTAYTEIRDSSIQDGSITVSGASTLFIEDSKIGTSTFSTAGSVIGLRNVTIDADNTVTIGAGVVYNLQDVTGNVIIDAGAVNVETALISAGLTATQAEGAVTSNFMHIRMHNADVEASPTHFVTRDAVTGELEITTVAGLIPSHFKEVFTATDGQTSVTLTKTPIGSVLVTRNGVDISDSWTWAGGVGTYDPALNLDCTIDADDKLRFHFEALA